MSTWRLLVLVVALSTTAVPPLQAHDIGNLKAVITFDGDRYQIDILVDPHSLLDQVMLDRGVLEPPIADGRSMVERLREVMPEVGTGIDVLFDGRRVPLTPTYRASVPDVLAAGLSSVDRSTVGTLHLSAPVPQGATTFAFSYRWTYGAMALLLEDGRQDGVQTVWIARGERSPVIPFRQLVPPTSAQVVADYVTLGFTHILPKGLDHILFVLGLFFLSAGWRSLLVQVSTFTAAHTLTLGLSSLGVLQLDSAIVEPLIALSIAYIALENLATNTLRPSRLALIFGFGLLHGLGFAGVLAELGFPAARFATALLSFNLGVELGQLTVLAFATVAVAGWRRHEVSLMPLVARPASVLIACGGLYWTVERVAGW
ncbi:MAG: HupE/UreJ family protein [Vicinamibacterales bacterium]